MSDKSVMSAHIVDFDADPMIPDGWEVRPDDQLSNIVEGRFEFDPKKVVLHLEEGQQDGGMIVGNELRKKLKDQPVYNANLLEFYLANLNLIPKEWKDKYVYFWGTIYRGSRFGDLYVRYLYWDDDRWSWSTVWLAYGSNGGLYVRYLRWCDRNWDVDAGTFSGLHPAVVSASSPAKATA